MADEEVKRLHQPSRFDSLYPLVRMNGEVDCAKEIICAKITIISFIIEEALTMSIQPKTRLTIEEYIELDKNSEERFEYFDGEVFNMSGVHPNHALLESRLITSLNVQTAGRGCFIYPSNLRVKVPSMPPYRYPDLSAL